MFHGPKWPSPAAPSYAYTDSSDNPVAEADAGRQAGLAGGLVITYSGFTMSAVNDLWWAFETAYPPQLSFTGSSWEDEETLKFDLGESDLNNGIAVWTETIGLSYYNGGLITTTVPVRCTVIVSGAGASSFTAASDVHDVYSDLDTSVGALAPVTGDMSVTVLFEAEFNSSWQPAAELFENLDTQGTDQCMISFGPAFAHTVYE